MNWKFEEYLYIDIAYFLDLDHLLNSILYITHLYKKRKNEKIYNIPQANTLF